MRITQKRKQEILRQVNKALEWQFETYTWENMIKDTMPDPGFSQAEIKWAINNTGYKAYICE